MHDELLAFAARLLADPPSPDPNTVKVAVLAFAGVVVSAAASVLVALRSPREHRPAPRRRTPAADQRYVRSLTRRIAEVEGERDAARSELATVKGRKSAYERFLWLHHFDPAKILTGDERVDDARI